MTDRSPVARRRSVVAACGSQELAPLGLQQLRAHRRLMGAEDDRVSYWICLTRARIERLEAKSTEQALTPERLAGALGDTGSGRTRRTIMRQSGADELPVLPDLCQMWAADVDPLDRGTVAKALEVLCPAERQLTAYSDALHMLMDDSTRELILRYRNDPHAALDALPQE